MNVSESSLLPYERERRGRRLQVAQSVAMGAASLTTGLTSVAAGQVAQGSLGGFVLDQLSPGTAADAWMPLRIASGVLAAANLGVAAYRVFGGEESPGPWRIASAAGSFVTAAGLAGQALGWGPWTAAVTGLGVVATVVTQTVQTYTGAR